MKIGLIAIAGVKIQNRKFVELGITLPQFVNRGQVIAQLPSLALLTLAGATPEDVDVEYLEVDDILAHVQDPRRDLDLVALSTYTARAFDAYEVADAYRALGVPVVIGGLHATVVPQEAARHADAVVVGEGETTWPRVVRDFQRGGRAALQRIYREERPGTFDLRHSPMPRFDLLRDALPSGPSVEVLDTHVLTRMGGYNRIPIQTTRGCPLDCEFCAASKLYGSRYRKKPIARVMAEVDAVRALWPRPFIEFADDNTFVHREWSLELLRGLAARDVRWFTESDVSVADDDEILDLLRPAGCRQILIGFESPRRRNLLGLDRAGWKAAHHDRYFAAIERIQARGVSVCGCFIVGLDGDGPEIFDDIRAFVEQSRLLEVQVTVLTPFPGTRLYDDLLAQGRILHPGDWGRCTLFDINHRPAGMTVEQLEDGLVSLWRDLWNDRALAARRAHYRSIVATKAAARAW